MDRQRASQGQQSAPPLALLFAAGEGRRLLPLTAERPKPALPLLNRPLMAFTLDHLAASGVRDAIVNLYHLPQALEEALERIRPEGLDLRLSRERVLLGTGGGLRQALRAWPQPHSSILVANADTLTKVDLLDLQQQHQASKPWATMVLRRPEQALGLPAKVVAKVESGRVLSIRDIPEVDASAGGQRFVFSGIHLLSRAALDDLPEQGCIIEAYHRALLRGDRVGAYVDDSDWRSIDTLQDYLRAHVELLRGEQRWPGLEVDEAGCCIHPSASVSARASLECCSVAAGAKIVGSARLVRTVVWEGCEVSEDLQDAIVTPRGIHRL